MQGFRFRRRWAPAYLVAIVGIQYAILLWLTVPYSRPWAALSWDRRVMAVWVVAMAFNWLRARVSPEGGCGEPVSATDGGALQVRRGEVECGAVFNDATADDGIWTPDAFMARVQLVGGIVLGLTGPFPDTAAARKAAESVAGVLNSVLGCRPLDVRMVERVQDYGPALRQLAL